MGRRLIVEADGGSRGNPGPAAYGAVVVDAQTGAVLAELADYLGVQTNNVAEYEGLTAGLRAARQVDPDALVEARLDSKLVVEQMSGGWAIRNPTLKTLARNARAILPPDQVTYRWVPRARNTRADALANRSLDAHEARRPARIESWTTTTQPGVDDPEDPVIPGFDTGEPGPGGADDVPPTAPPPVRIVGWSRADLGEPSTLLLVRHGVTQHSVEHRFSGHGGADPGLLDLGLRQAEAVSEELHRRGGADVLVTSPLLRARQTAQVIAERLGMPDPVVVEGLAESAFGEWDGLTLAQAQQGWPYQVASWMTSPEVAPPGGESFVQVRDRVDAARREVLARFPRQRVIAVAHVTPIKVLIQSVLDAPAASAYRFELAPCSLSTLAWWADGVSTVFGMGERGHLHGVLHDTA